MILSFGSLNIDHVYQLPHIVRPGETLGASFYRIHPGGKGLNQSLAMARAGLSVCHAGRIGEDGEWLRGVLQDSGVDCQHVECCAREHTGHAMIQVSEQGENCIVLHGGANQTWPQAAIENLFVGPTNWQAVVCQNEMNGLSTLLRCAKQIPIIFNAAPYGPNLSELDLSRVHTLLVNETEAMELAGQDTLDRAFVELKRRYTQVRLVMTLGADGLRASHCGQDYQMAAFPTQLVDSTAAGDTFTGYYAASMLLHRPGDFAAALTLGSRAAALAVSQEGAAPSIPSIEQLKLD